jgi:hypothetical protein
MGDILGDVIVEEHEVPIVYEKRIIYLCKNIFRV